MAGEGKVAELMERVEEMRTHHCPRSFGGQCDLCVILAAVDALKAENAQMEKQIAYDFKPAEEAMNEVQKLRELVGRLGEGLGRIAYEPIGHAEASAVQVLAAVVEIARELHAAASAVAGQKGERDG